MPRARFEARGVRRRLAPPGQYAAAPSGRPLSVAGFQCETQEVVLRLCRCAAFGVLGHDLSRAGRGDVQPVPPDDDVGVVELLLLEEVREVVQLLAAVARIPLVP